MPNRQGFVPDSHHDAKVPAFTPAHLDYLQGVFGKFKQNESPQSLNDMISLSHAASEHLGAIKVLNHISSIISGKEEASIKPGDMSKQTPAFQADAPPNP